MGKFTEDAEGVLESKGVDPDQPLVLQLLGDKFVELYYELYEEKVGRNKAESQRIAVDKACKALSVTDSDEWRKDFERDGYVKMWSQLLEESFYLCRNSTVFDFITGGGDAVTKFAEGLVCYTASELPHLKTLLPEDVKWMHEAKKFGGKLVSSKK
jgi:hypothetical protein